MATEKVKVRITWNGQGGELDSRTVTHDIDSDRNGFFMRFVDAESAFAAQRAIGERAELVAALRAFANTISPSDATKAARALLAKLGEGKL